MWKEVYPHFQDFFICWFLFFFLSSVVAPRAKWGRMPPGPFSQSRRGNSDVIRRRRRERGKRPLAPASDIPHEWQAHNNGKCRANWLGGGEQGGKKRGTRDWLGAKTIKTWLWTETSAYTVFWHLLMWNDHNFGLTMLQLNSIIYFCLSCANYFICFF